MADTPTAQELIEKLKASRTDKFQQEQSRVGIQGENLLGVSMYEVRRICNGIHDHELAQELWDSGIHEARIMAALVDIPQEVTHEQMNAWVEDFDSWDVCDQVTTSLFDQTPISPGIVFDWAEREEEFIRRAAFATIAGLAWHNKEMSDQEFEDYFPLIRTYSNDPRNYVKKAVNWALRNMGKRNPQLFEKCFTLAEELAGSANKTARWIGFDALREFRQKQEKMMAKKEVKS
jgi:3-methyladenine DNA glycosylase AlkD